MYLFSFYVSLFIYFYAWFLSLFKNFFFYVFPFIFLCCIKITAPHEKHFLLRSLASLVSMPAPCWILASLLEGNLIGDKKSISLINSFHFNFSWFCSHACSFVSRLSLSQRYYFSLDLNLNVFFINQKNVS